MKHARIKLIYFIAGLSLILLSCDDFFEENISDKTIQVVCPADNTKISSNQLSFVWNEEEGAEKYHVIIVSPSFASAQVYVCDTILTGYKMKLELPDGDYQWSIQAENFGYKSLINYLTFKVAGNEE